MSITLKQYRSSKKLSQRKLAEMLSITQATYSRIENQAANPSFELAKAIFDFSEGKVNLLEVVGCDA